MQLVCTWNVNGLTRCIRGKGLEDFLRHVEAEILQNLPDSCQSSTLVCAHFQEVKLRRREIGPQLARVPGWDIFYSVARNVSGVPFNRFSGVGSFMRRTYGKSVLGPTHLAREGISWACPDPVDQEITNLLDREGRILTLIPEDGEVIFINVYALACRDAARAVIKEESHKLLQRMVEKLVQEFPNKSLILLGDLNLTASPLDTCDPEGWAERNDQSDGKESAASWFRSFLAKFDLVDAYRYYHPTNAKVFTCWNQVSGARETNYGTRLDYILVSRLYLARFGLNCFCLSGIYGSDHCPVVLILAEGSIPAAHSAGEGALEYERSSSALCAGNWPEAKIVQLSLADTLTKRLSTRSVELGSDASCASASSSLEANEAQELEGGKCLMNEEDEPSAPISEAPPNNPAALIAPTSKTVNKSAGQSKSKRKSSDTSSGPQGRIVAQAQQSSLMAFLSPKKKLRASGVTSIQAIELSDEDSDAVKDAASVITGAKEGHPACFSQSSKESEDLNPDGIHNVGPPASRKDPLIGAPHGERGGIAGPPEGQECDSAKLDKPQTKAGPERLPFRKAASLNEETVNRMREAVRYLSKKEQESYFATASVAPLCSGHRLPAILRKTKKEGRNEGRRFWTCCCSSGDPMSPKSRCHFFKWQ